MKFSSNVTLLSSLLFAFFVQVKIPAGMSRTYDNVQSIELIGTGFAYKLTLENGKIAYAPTLFTFIEEK